MAGKMDFKLKSYNQFQLIMVCIKITIKKFVFLNALKPKQLRRFFYQVADVFAVIETPDVLHSDHGRNLSFLKEMWSSF